MIGMYENRVKNDRKILLKQIYHRVNKETQCRKIHNNWCIYINDFEFHGFGFPCSHEKRVGIPKFFLSFFTLFLYVCTLLPEYIYIHIVNATPSKSLMIIGYIIKS